MDLRNASSFNGGSMSTPAVKNCRECKKERENNLVSQT
jgi:hypothetical protein